MISFDAAIFKLAISGMLNLSLASLNCYRADLDKPAKSPESSLIPTGDIPALMRASATHRKLGTPLYNVSYVSTKHRNPLGMV